MTKWILTLTSSTGASYGRLETDRGQLTATCFDRALEPLVARWRSEGLNEWVGAGEHAVPRHTPASHPDFLPRLSVYVARQVPLTAVLQRIDQVDGSWVLQSDLTEGGPIRAAFQMVSAPLRVPRWITRILSSAGANPVSWSWKTG